MKRGFTLIELLVVIAIIAIWRLSSSRCLPRHARRRGKRSASPTPGKSPWTSLSMRRTTMRRCPPPRASGRGARPIPASSPAPRAARPSPTLTASISSSAASRWAILTRRIRAVLTADWNDRGGNAAAFPNTITSKDDIHQAAQQRRGLFLRRTGTWRGRKTR